MGRNDISHKPLLLDLQSGVAGADGNVTHSSKQGESPGGKYPAEDSVSPLLRRIALKSMSFMGKHSPRGSQVAKSYGGEDAKNDSSQIFSPINSKCEDVQIVISPRSNPSNAAATIVRSRLSTKSVDGIVGTNKNQDIYNTKERHSPKSPRSVLARNTATSNNSSPRVELAKRVFFGRESENANLENRNSVREDSIRTTIVGRDIDPELCRSATLGTTTKGTNPIKKFNSERILTRHRSAQAPNENFAPVSRRGLSSSPDNDYTLFRTRSGKFGRPSPRSQSRRQDDSSSQRRALPVSEIEESSWHQGLPAGRYFDALKGPELEILKDSEEILLPLDQQWPFLLRFPIGCFGITLGLGSQTILWKTLATNSSMKFLHIPNLINLMLWGLALVTLIAVFTIYSLKCVFYFEAVRREFYHPVRVNFFFAPWIACMFLTIGVPPAISTSVHPVLWCLFMGPVFVLELKIYGQWLSGGHRRLSLVANPSTHLSLVGNFVGALLAAMAGWKEAAIFFWAVGLAHYLVVFVTLYQRLPTAEVLTKELHPIFFLFVAAPNAACVSWESIVGEFDYVSRICYFVGTFLYASLAVRWNFFRGFRFTVAWWAYTFPMTASAIATIHYSHEVRHPITQGLAVFLSSVSAITVFILFVSTIFHACLWGTLFPNDIAIAITSKRRKRKLKVATDNSLCEVTVDSLPNGGDECHKDGSNNLPK
eukprot:c20948_g2_i1 orf=255-2381(-)